MATKWGNSISNSITLVVIVCSIHLFTHLVITAAAIQSYYNPIAHRMMIMKMMMIAWTTTIGVQHLLLSARYVDSFFWLAFSCTLYTTIRKNKWCGLWCTKRVVAQQGVQSSDRRRQNGTVCDSRAMIKVMMIMMTCNRSIEGLSTRRDQCNHWGLRKIRRRLCACAQKIDGLWCQFVEQLVSCCC